MTATHGEIQRSPNANRAFKPCDLRVPLLTKLERIVRWR
jgi:hypothetical protein